MSYSKELYLIEGTRIRRYKIGRNTKPIVLVRKRLYRVDDPLCVSTCDGRKTAAFYRLESTQSLGMGIYLDPDNTMAHTDVGRGRKNATKINEIKPELLLYGAIAVVIVFSVLTGGIV